MRISPWGVAGRLFRPTPSGWGTLDRLVTWRSVIGMATLIVVNLGVRAPGEVLSGEGLNKAWANTLYGFCAVPVAMLAVYFCTYRPQRGDLAVGVVLQRVLVLPITIAIPMSVLFVIGFFPEPRQWLEGDSHLAVKIGVGLAVLWFAGYFVCVAYWAGRTYCWVGDFHPLLGPAVSSVMVLGVTGITLLGADTRGLSADVWLVLQLGGLFSTLVLSAVEYRLHRRRGVGWRTGPKPRPAHGLPPGWPVAVA